MPDPGPGNGFSEVLESRSWSFDSMGYYHHERKYKIWGWHPDEIHKNPAHVKFTTTETVGGVTSSMIHQLDPIGTVWEHDVNGPWTPDGSPDPNASNDSTTITDLVLYRYDVVRNNSNVFFLIGRATNDPRVIGKMVDDGSTWQTHQVEFPFVQWSPVYSTGNAPPAAGWTDDSYSIDEGWFRQVYTILLQKQYRNAAKMAAKRNARTINSLNNVPSLFQGADFAFHSPILDRVTYSWLQDTGTRGIVWPPPSSLAGGDEQNKYPKDLYVYDYRSGTVSPTGGTGSGDAGSDVYLRPPFYRVALRKIAVDSIGTLKPEFPIWCPYKFDGFAWLNLVGSEQLPFTRHQ